MADDEAQPTRVHWSPILYSVIFASALVYHFTVGKYTPTYVSTGRLLAQRSPTQTDSCDYVRFKPPKTRNGLGNHMFYLAGVIYVARLTGRHSCVWTTKNNGSTLLDTVFNINIPRFMVKSFGCPLQRFKQKGVYLHNPRVESLKNVSRDRSLVVRGAFASWKYVDPVSDQIRQKLTFHDDLTKFVADFFEANVPPGWTNLSYVRVGVHVRRGDFLKAWAKSRGFTTAGKGYFLRAMNYFVEHFSRVQFIVASNNIAWCKKHISASVHDSRNVNVTFFEKHNTGQDLALLSSCNHTIMSTGTFSWWAAWLANGITVYYANFPRNGSWLSTQFRRLDFQHSEWIGMGD